MIKVENLVKIYKSKNKKECKALDNVSFVLPDKGLVYIIGKSGSGKSTLLNMIGGLDNLTSGLIEVDGLNIEKSNEKELYSYRGSNIGFIFQDFHLLDNLTVKENIGLSLKLLNNYDEEKVEKVIKDVELDNTQDKYPSELSGGQQQRVAIARALVKNPKIIIADEPTGNLDSNTTKQITHLLKEISKDKLVLIVSHNLYDAFDYADRIIELSEGKVINDLSLNEKYNNEISIEDNSLYIPMLKRFEDEELSYIYNSIFSHQVSSLKQKTDKFIKSKDIKYIKGEGGIKKINLPLKETFKFSYLFGKNRFIKFIFSSFLTAMMLVVLFLGQSISYFKPSSVIKDIMSEDVSSFCIRKNVDITKDEIAVKNITDEDLKEFYDLGYEGNIYKLYNVTLPLCNIHTLSGLTLPSSTVFSPYPNETSGVLVTNEEFAKQILELDELEIYDNGVVYNPGGFYVTDYAVDGMLNANKFTNFYKNFDSYDDFLGRCNIIGGNTYIHAYINGIIKTNYKEKLSSIMEEIQTKLDNDEFELTEEYISYFDLVSNSYAISFSFNENFLHDYANSYETRSYQYVYNIQIDDKNLVESKVNIGSASSRGYNLNSDEIIISYTDYNKMFNTSYTAKDYKTFTPHKVKLKISADPEKKRFYEREVTIASIALVSGSKILVSDNLFYDIKKENTFSYGICFENNDTLDMVIDNLDTQEYVIFSNKISAVSTMSKAVSVFNDFFDLIVILILSSIVFLLISFGVKNVNGNMYEIGVLKALGCNQRKFIVMFGLHTIILIILICLMSVIGVALTYEFANEILVESLKVLAPGFIMIELNFIRFDLGLILNNCVLVFIISIVSTIVSIIKLRTIKPIQIIKAKE